MNNKAVDIFKFKYVKGHNILLSYCTKLGGSRAGSYSEYDYVVNGGAMIDVYNHKTGNVVTFKYKSALDINDSGKRITVWIADNYQVKLYICDHEETYKNILITKYESI